MLRWRLEVGREGTTEGLSQQQDKRKESLSQQMDEREACRGSGIGGEPVPVGMGMGGPQCLGTSWSLELWRGQQGLSAGRGSL